MGRIVARHSGAILLALLEAYLIFVFSMLIGFYVVENVLNFRGLEFAFIESGLLAIVSYWFLRKSYRFRETKPFLSLNLKYASLFMFLSIGVVWVYGGIFG